MLFIKYPKEGKLASILVYIDDIKEEETEGIVNERI